MNTSQQVRDDTAQQYIFSSDQNPEQLRSFIARNLMQPGAVSFSGILQSLYALAKFRTPDEPEFQFALDCLEVVAEHETGQWSTIDAKGKLEVWGKFLNILCTDFQDVSFNFSNGITEPNSLFLASIFKRFPSFLAFCNRPDIEVTQKSLTHQMIASSHVRDIQSLRTLKDVGLDFSLKTVHGTPLFSINSVLESSIPKALWLIFECGNDAYEEMDFVSYKGDFFSRDPIRMSFMQLMYHQKGTPDSLFELRTNRLLSAIKSHESNATSMAILRNSGLLNTRKRVHI